MYTVLLDGSSIHDPALNDSKKIIFDGVVTKKVNYADSFEFTIYPDNDGYSSITLMVSSVEVYKDGNLIFHGRPLSEETGWNNEKKVVCEGDLALFNDTVIRPYEYSGTVGDYVRYLVNQHNSQVGAGKQITVRNITVTDPNDYIVRSCGDYVKTLSELMDKTVGIMGGYLITEYSNGTIYLDYLVDSISGTNQTLAVGKNILDFQRSLSSEALATALIPLGATDDEGNRLTIKSVNGGSDYISDTTAVGERGLIYATYTWDDVTVAANLLTKAQALLTDLTRIVPRIQLSAVDLTNAGYNVDAIGFFEYVTVQDTAHNASGQYLITERSWNLSAPENDTVTFGDEEKTISGQAARTQTSIDRLFDTVINKAVEIIDYQTDLLKGGAGGYVVVGTDTDGHPSELFFMDTDSTATAVSVLRINENGIGFSTNGINGPYTNAWTIDGSLNASFVTTGILKDTATNGQKFYVNLETGEVRLEELNLVVQKVENIGGRNLIQGTLTPVVTPVDSRPKIIGQTTFTTGQTNATWSAADITSEGVKYGHGFRVTNTDARRPFVRFGTATVSAGSLNGLVAGWTYTMSGRCQFRQMSNYSGSDTYAMRVSLYTDAENPGSSFAASSYLDIYSITPSLAGAIRAKRFAFTFTVPSAATMAYIIVRCTQTSDSAYGTSDYIDLRDLKLERGEVATGWTPAPEDQVGNDEIITKINATPESVLIQASRIDLQGSVSISSLTAAAQAALVTGTTVKNQYYLSTSSSSATGGSWSDTEPTWSSGKYVWTRVATTKTFADGTSSTTNSTAVYDANLTSALSTASSAQTTASGAVASTVSVYYRSTTSTTPTISTSTTIGTSATTDNAWEYVMPRPKNSCYFYTCEKYTKQDGTVSFSTVRQMANLTYTSLWCSASDATCIDGASIYTGSVTADKITVSDLQALGATIGGWTINSTSISKDTTIDGETYHAFVSAPASPTSANRAFGVRKGSSTYPFQVTYDGKLKATGVDLTGTFNMTGGGINIVTDSSSSDVIVLSYTASNYSAVASMSPGSYSVGLTTSSRDSSVYINGANGLTLSDSVLHRGITINHSYPQISLSDTSAARGIVLEDDRLLISCDNKNAVQIYGNPYSGNDAHGTINLLNGVQNKTVASLKDDTIRGNLTLTTVADASNVTLIPTGMTFQNASGTTTATYPSTGYPWGNLVSNGEETSDLDNCTASGRYTFTSAAANTPYSAGGVVDVYKNSSTYMYQLAVSNNSTNDDVAYINIRKHNSSGWHEWQRIITPSQGVVALSGNFATSYSTSGTTQTYTLEGGTYLVTTSRINSSLTTQDGVWLVMVYPSGTSHMSALISPSGTTTVSISAGTLTLTTGSQNVRITITKLS